MSEVWDVNWFGSTKTLDVHIGWLRRKLGDDAAQPRYIETVRGVGFRFAASGGRRAVTLRRAPAAGAGLRAGAGARRPRACRSAVSLRDRVDAEVRSQARSQADVVAASSSELLEPASARRCAAWSGSRRRARAVASSWSARAAGCWRTPPERRAGQDYANRPEIQAALGGQGEQITRGSKTLGDAILATSAPVLIRGRTVGAVRITQSVDAVHRAVRPRSSTSPSSRGSSSCSPSSPGRSSRGRSRGRSSVSTRPRDGSRPATSTPPSTSRAAPSSARSPVPSTR